MRTLWNRRRPLWVLAGTLIALGAMTGMVWAFAGPSLVREGADDTDSTGLWTGSAYATTITGNKDLSIGYTMRSDFWFVVNANGDVTGKAYAIYQPTFDAAGLNAKLDLMKSAADGVLELLPGAQLALVKQVLQSPTGTIAKDLALGGMIKIAATFNDPEPVRTGTINGSLHNGVLTLTWTDPAQAEGIPMTVALKLLNRKDYTFTNTKLKIAEPWATPATLDIDSGDRFAFSQRQDSTTERGITQSTFTYWSAASR